MSGANDGPGAVHVRPGILSINPRAPQDRIALVLLNTGDRPVQLGSHLHLPDCNSAIDLDRVAADGFRLDIPAGTSVRFEPGVSRAMSAVRLAGRRRVPGIQMGKQDD